ncbi:tubulin glycylase 3C-like isoform X5 [Ostrea edulis]|uniref:tubulin glycylase 3C-like isoform X5 n=1 Tax=Ostrea edulis TaxID=37623 RepID=UPI0024AF139F|nr:tubulin glycylase 3C-like isoform X5 [Ostrea edulis]
MMKLKEDARKSSAFIPKISEASRKIATRRLKSLDSNVPHFMRDIKCRTVEPLGPIASDRSVSSGEKEEEESNQQETANESCSTSKQHDKNVNKSPVYDLRTGKMTTKSGVFLDDNIFTFRPKVSTASQKIVQNLGTDFMARQQQHLDRQKRNGAEEGDLSNSVDDPADGIKGQVEDGDIESIDGKDGSRSKNMSPGLQRLMDGPYAQSNTDMVLKRHKTRLVNQQLKAKVISELDVPEEGVTNSENPDNSEPQSNSNGDPEGDVSGSLSRSKTMPSLGRPKISRKLSNINCNFNTDRLKAAKEQAEKAIKNRKVFTIQGGYNAVRQSLRKRGWVEKFYKMATPPKKTPRKRRKTVDDSDDDDDDDDDDDYDDDDDDGDSDNDQPKTPPWEEDDGIYGIMSRIVRNVNPTFIWVLKRDIVDYRFLTRDQMVNHYVKAGSFTTKVGLCINMRNIPWFDNSDPDTFYPRCYRLSHEEEKNSFIDDYRLTMCANILKIVSSQYKNETISEEEESRENGEEKKDLGSEKTESEKNEENSEKKDSDSNKKDVFVCTNPECTRSRPGVSSGNICAHAKERLEKLEKEKTDSENKENKPKEKTPDIVKPIESAKTPSSSRSLKQKGNKKKKKVTVPMTCLERAIEQCDKFIQERCHDDLDVLNDPHELTQQQWDETLKWYYQLVNDGGQITNVSGSQLAEVDRLLYNLKLHMPQYEMDGYKNIWIVKPGAKSRGRGIVCYDKLEDMLKLVSSQVVRKDNKYVVQKYMERPFLIYNCKFDIRQWFLVTDWNPLTIWFYQDSYLRFCSQEYTLEDFDESIHLSNNAIQKHYKNGPRHPLLPPQNMWTHEEFKDYIKGQGHGNQWEELIYPGMKKAIICALLSTQDVIEYRKPSTFKSSFELYGADFMLTEDYRPWLIEINSSPSMESSTEITRRMCTNVLEDSIKVVVDRKYDRNCDIGRFELAYKQPLVTVPPYIGINLCVEGQTVRRPNGFNLRKSMDNDAYFTPRKPPAFATESKEISIKPTPPTAKRPQSESCDAGHKNTNASNSAPAKGKSAPGESQDHQHKNNTQKRTSHKSQNDQNQVTPSTSHSSCNSESSDRTIKGMRETNKDNKDRDNCSQVSLSQPQTFPKAEKSGYLPISSCSAWTGKKMVSTTSVSSNYTIPNLDKFDRPTLAVNNVESTDLQTIKPVNTAPPPMSLAGAITKGLSPLIDGAWGRTCAECGNGMNLHLDNSNPQCICKQDSLCVPPGYSSSESYRAARGFPSRPKSSYSPRPPSASACSLNSTGSFSSTTTSFGVMPSRLRADKKLLRYTDGGIKRPVTPVNYPASNALPRLVRRYIGRRSIQCHELPLVNASSAVFIDTSQLNNPLSITPHGFPNR